MGWYVNLQVPFHRTEIGIDSLDLELDLLVSRTYDVFLKDEEHVDQSAALGRFSEDDAVAIHALGRRLKAQIESGGHWWDDRWGEWSPSPELLMPPSLPAGWADEPTDPGADLGLTLS